MKKSRAIAILLCVLLLLAGATYIDLYGIDAEGSYSASDIKLGLDLAGGVSITYQVVGDEEPDKADMNDTETKMRDRAEKENKEAVVYQEGNNRICIEIPGVENANEVLQKLGRPGSLYFIAETDSDGNANYTGQYVQGEDGSIESVWILNKTIEEMMVDGSIMLEGTDVESATARTGWDEWQNSIDLVELVMTPEGKEKFAAATENAYVKNETLGIYYDGKIISAPAVNDIITEGVAQISPMESPDKAKELAEDIRIGGLKLELEEIHSKVVGAQLGQEAVTTSLKAAAIGIIIVIVFMIAVYFVSGFASSIALLVYVALTVLLIRGFDWTLTLAGIAGVILSIGMAVDANVIIFARIREELATGKTVKSAIKIGYDKALSAIIDGNITTFIAAVVLLVIAPGTVKGFAQTLALGIALSMFTALFITKYLMYALYTLGLKSEKWYGVTKERKTIDFLGKKGIFFGASAAVIVAGFVVMGVNKATTEHTLNFSLEFVGGTATTVNFPEAMTLEEINNDIVPLIEEITGSAVQIQTVRDSSEVIFKTNNLEEETRAALNQMFMDSFGVKETQIISETISASLSNEMRIRTILAVVFAILCMLIYIRIRFTDIRFGISSIMALLHDVLVVLAFYAVARISVGNTFIACMLTIVGYSINATIVVFDRIRENMAEMTRKDELKDVVNKSITQTLSRSIFTSLTTFVMVGCLYVFGVTSIRDFALPLMVGIVAGAYSSVCIAGAMWCILRKKFPPKVVEE